MNTPISSTITDGPQADAGACFDSVDVTVLDADLSRLGQLSGEELLTLISDVARVLRRAEAVLVAGSHEVAVRSDKARGPAGLAARHGFARPSQLIEQVTGVSARTAGRYGRVGAVTGHRLSEIGVPLPPLFPAVSDALGAGLIGVDCAEVITKALQDAAPRAKVADLVAAEQALVGQATGASVPGGLAVPADLVAGQARLWRDRLDPDGIEPRAESAFGRREFWVSRRAENDLVPFGGKLTVDVAGKLHAVFDAILTPRTTPQYLHDDEEAQEQRGSRKDPRTPGQQRADVFAAMIDSLARSGDLPTISGAAPTVLVTVPAQVLTDRQGTGQIVGVADLVPYSAVEQILCDGAVQPVFLDPGGGVAGLASLQRTFTRVQKLAIIARDGPSCHECDIPATGCEVHHIVPWSQGGKTVVETGVIMCWFHHRMMHTGEWTMTVVDGTPVTIPPAWMNRKPYFHP